MNERIKLLAKQATQQYSPTYYTQEWIQGFAELIVNECCQRMSQETIRHDGYGYNQHALYQILRGHFGVEE